MTSGVATDGQTYCTFGKARPSPVVFTPADALGNALPPPFSVASRQPSDGGLASKVDPSLLQQKAAPGDETVQKGASQGKPPGSQSDEEVSDEQDSDDRGHALREQHGDNSSNELVGTPDIDVMTGGGEADRFVFPVLPGPANTLNVERITDYEFGETIVVEGVALNVNAPFIEGGARGTGALVDLDYHEEWDQTWLNVTWPGGAAIIILDGDKRGTVRVTFNCCSRPASEITITRDSDSQTAEADEGQSDPQAEPVGEQAEESQSEPSESPAPQQRAGSQSEPQDNSEQQPAPQQDAESQSQPAEEPVQTGEDKSVPKEQKDADASNGVTIFFKVTESVLEGQPTGSELKEEKLIKLVALEDPPLPTTTSESKEEQDSGFDRSPVTCTAGADGQCEADIPAEDRKIYGFPASGPRFYQTALDLPRNSGVVIEKEGTTVTPLPQVSDGVILTEANFKIGDRTFTRIAIGAPASAVPGIIDKLREAFGPKFQIDYCGEKKPGPPLGLEPASYSSLNSELPEATIRFDSLMR